MQRVMEVYDLSMDKNSQLNSQRTYNCPQNHGDLPKEKTKSENARTISLLVAEEMERILEEHKEEFVKVITDTGLPMATYMTSVTLDHMEMIAFHKEISFLSQTGTMIGYAIGKGYLDLDKIKRGLLK